ncbi:MAG: hypothetical protein WC879_18500 [Melioribacteraceae bacterium]
MAGFLELKNANLSGDLSGVALAKPETLVQTDVKWFLSIDKNDLTKLSLSAGTETTDNTQLTTDNVLRTFRSIKIDNEELEFTDGFTDLHAKVYEKTLTGEGFGIEDSRKSIELVYRLRNEKLSTNFEREKLHPYLNESV